jgi:hypothetical protein
MVSRFEVETLVNCLRHAGIRTVQHFTKCTTGLALLPSN